MQKFLDVLFVVIRFPVILAVLPFGLLAGILKTLGEWGEWLDDACHSASRAICWALNPRAWALAKEIKARNTALESSEKFYRTQYESIAAELSEAKAASVPSSSRSSATSVPSVTLP